MRVLQYTGMPDAKAEKTASPARKDSKRSDQDYLELLAKEFNSIPDREVPPSEVQEDDQLAAMNQASKITTKPDKESVDQRNVHITKTIRSAMKDMHIGR